MESTALRLAIDMKLFDAAAPLSANGAVFKLEDLISEMKGDPVLVRKC